MAMKTTTTMATGDDDNDNGNGTMGDGATGNDDNDDCDKQRALVAPLTLQPPTVALRTTTALRLPQHPRCCNCSAAVTLCIAATLCAAATAAPPPSFGAPSLLLFA